MLLREMKGIMAWTIPCASFVGFIVLLTSPKAMRCMPRYFLDFSYNTVERVALCHKLRAWCAAICHDKIEATPSLSAETSFRRHSDKAFINSSFFLLFLILLADSSPMSCFIRCASSMDLTFLHSYKSSANNKQFDLNALWAHLRINQTTRG